MAHRFAVGEDPQLSQPATIDLSKLIRGHSLVSAKEIALTGGASLGARVQSLKWDTTTADQKLNKTTIEGKKLKFAQQQQQQERGQEKLARVNDRGTRDNAGQSQGEESTWLTTIGPMEIKTYRLVVADDNIRV